MSRPPHRVVVIFASAAALLVATPAVAADSGASDWRATYDTIMMWVNFVILAALLIKLSRKPLREFFATQRRTLAAQIEKLEAEKQQTSEEIRRIRNELEAHRARFETVRDKIIAQGEKQCDLLMAQARQQAALVLNTTRQRIEANLREAGATLKSELIDTAIALAVKSLPRQITPADNHKWVERFVEQVGSDNDTAK